MVRRIFGLFSCYGDSCRMLLRDDDLLPRWPYVSDDCALRHARKIARRGDRAALQMVAIHQHEKPTVKAARRQWRIA
jgi:hypothetical protein